MTTVRTGRPLPVIDDVDTAGHWEAASRGALAIRVCAECDAVLHMPVAYCRSCGSWRTDWEVVAPRGRIYSWTVVHRQIHPAFPAPYTLALIELLDRPQARLIGYLPGVPELAAGRELVAGFVEIDGISLPEWRLVAEPVGTVAAVTPDRFPAGT